MDRAEKYKEYQRLYRLKNKEKAKEYAREYHLKNKEKVKEYHKSEKRMEKYKEWYESPKGHKSRTLSRWRTWGCHWRPRRHL